MFEPGANVGGWGVDALLDDGPTTLTYKVHRKGDCDEFGVLRLLKVKDASFGDRLRRNAAALSDHHEHLVDVIDVVEHEGFAGVVSEFIDGPDLAAWSATRPPLGAALALFTDVIAGLHEAHRAGLVHRNLKPGKIRVTQDHRALLEDFLLSRVMDDNGPEVTALGITFGTPQYMSPEQFHGAADVSEQGDLFSAGCVLFELVTGKRAFDGDSIKDVYMAIIDAQYTDPRTLVRDLPEPVAALIDDLLQAATEDRPASAAEVLERLQSTPLAELVDRPTEPLTPPPLAAPRKNIPPSEMKTVLDESETRLDPAPPLIAPEAPVARQAMRGSSMLWLAAGGGLVFGVAGFMVLVLLAGGLLAGR
jgi:serine/threonine protein kinase